MAEWPRKWTIGPSGYSLAEAIWPLAGVPSGQTSGPIGQVAEAIGHLGQVDQVGKAIGHLLPKSSSGPHGKLLKLFGQKQVDQVAKWPSDQVAR